MNTDNLILTILGGLFTGAGVIWLFMQGLLKSKDTKITDLETKVELLEQKVLELTTRFVQIETESKFTDSLSKVLNHIDSKIDELIKSNDNKKQKSKTI